MAKIGDTAALLFPPSSRVIAKDNPLKEEKPEFYSSLQKAFDDATENLVLADNLRLSGVFRVQDDQARSNLDIKPVDIKDLIG